MGNAEGISAGGELPGIEPIYGGIRTPGVQAQGGEKYEQRHQGRGDGLLPGNIEWCNVCVNSLFSFDQACD